MGGFAISIHPLLKYSLADATFNTTMKQDPNLFLWLFFFKVALKIKIKRTIKTSISGKGYIANMAASGHRNVQSVSDKRF